MSHLNYFFLKWEILFSIQYHSVYHLFEMFCRITKSRAVLSIMRKLTPREVESLLMSSTLWDRSGAGGQVPGIWGPSLFLDMAAFDLPPHFQSPLWYSSGEVQVHKALFVWLNMPTSSCSNYRVVILICQETQNNCFYSSQWMLMHMTFWEHISGSCRGTNVHVD